MATSRKLVAAKDGVSHDQEPKYTRINGRDLMSEDSWSDETGASIFETEWRDIDVNDDGIHWFHLMGAFCVKHERRYHRKRF